MKLKVQEALLCQEFMINELTNYRQEVQSLKEKDEMMQLEMKLVQAQGQEVAERELEQVKTQARDMIEKAYEE